MMNILHLTDLHVGANERGIDATARWTELVELLCAGRLPARASESLLVFTGDFVDAADARSYQIVEAGLRRLVAAGFSYTACPGNHDLFRPEDRKIDHALAVLFKTCVLGPLPNRGDWLLVSQPGAYPMVHVSATGVGVVMLDSEAEAVDDSGSQKGKGQLGNAQRDALHSALDTEPLRSMKSVVVGLHHNPFAKGLFAFMKLNDHDELVRTLAPVRSIRVMLFGHLHKGSLYRPGGAELPDHVALAAEGGMATGFNGKSDPLARLINPRTGEVIWAGNPLQA